MDIDYSKFVPQVHFELIPIANLVSNQEYQRSLSWKHIDRAAENFDPYQINPVKVSVRDGMYYVFNGQHTIEIIARVSGSRQTPVWCMVYDDLEYQHEADIFANQQKFVKPLLPIEVFNANIEAGNDAQLIIRDIVRSYNMEIGPSKKPGVICAVSTLENIYSKYGYQVLNRVLRLIVGAWEGDSNSFSSNIMNGITRMIVAYGDSMDDELFCEKLGVLSVKQLIRTAKDRAGGSLGYAEAMVFQYNGKKKNMAGRLQISLLHKKNAVQDLDSEEEADDESQEGMSSFFEE